MESIIVDNSQVSYRQNAWKNRLSKVIALTRGGFNSLSVQMLPDIAIKLPASAHRQYWQGVHPDGPLLSFLAESLPKDGVYFDIGANIGIYAAALWAIKSGQIKIVVFEPIASTIAVMEELLVLNQVEAKIEPIALSSESGLLTLSAYGNGANNFWVKDAEHLQVPTTTTPKITLDEWCSQHPDYIPHAIKIDVEGHELDVLKGARQTLSTHKPALVVECHCASWEDLGVSRQDFIDTIQSLGYRQLLDAKGNTIDFLTQTSTIHLLCR